MHFFVYVFLIIFWISLHFLFSLFLLISLYFFSYEQCIFMFINVFFPRCLDQPNSVESNLLQPAPSLSLAEHGMILIYFDSGERELRILHAISPDVYNIFIHIPKEIPQFRLIWGVFPAQSLMEVFVYGGIHSATPDRVLNDGFWS